MPKLFFHGAINVTYSSPILELYALCHSDTVLSNLGATIGGLDNSIPTLRTQSHLGVREESGAQ